MEEIKLKDSERQRCEVWTRVMGYHRPYQSFNIGKKQEFKDRKYFNESKVEPHLDITRVMPVTCECRG